MTQSINLYPDTSFLLEKCMVLTGLPMSDLINRLLSAHLTSLHELLALVDAHPNIHEKAANLLQSFGPESLDAGITYIAPDGYETLSARFKREMIESTTLVPISVP